MGLRPIPLHLAGQTEENSQNHLPFSRHANAASALGPARKILLLCLLPFFGRGGAQSRFLSKFRLTQGFFLVYLPEVV